jgi:aquaporin Z
VSLSKRAFAEFVGTLWLVFGGCGSAVLAAGFPNLGIGFLGVALAFGLTVLTMAYAIGHISGCHLNPAVSLGLVAGKRFPASELPAYIVAQVLGGIAGAGLLYSIASGKDGFSLAGGFASNGYAAHSPGGYAWARASSPNWS